MENIKFNVFQNPVDGRWDPDHAAMFAPHA
jgi:hypothetical protein